MSLWDSLIEAIIRPPRDQAFSDHDLTGGASATFEHPQSRGKKWCREDTILPGELGNLRGYHIKPLLPPTTPMPVVIYLHTNAGSRKDAREIIQHVVPHCTVFSFDFSGCGHSDGDWVTLGHNEVKDVRTVVAHLRQDPTVGAIAFWGRSMGAVSALLYSHTDPSIAAMVLDSPFSRLSDLMYEVGSADKSQGGPGLPRPLAKVAISMLRRSVKKRAQFDIKDVDPLSVAPSTHVPALFAHGKDDDFVKCHHSEVLYKAYGGEVKNIIMLEGGHNDARPRFFYDSGVIFLLAALKAAGHIFEEIDVVQ